MYGTLISPTQARKREPNAASELRHGYSAFDIQPNGLSAWAVGQGRDDSRLAVPKPDRNAPCKLLELSDEVLVMVLELVDDPAVLQITASTCRRLRELAIGESRLWNRLLHDPDELWSGTVESRMGPHPPRRDHARREVLDIMARRHRRSPCQICLKHIPSTWNNEGDMSMNLCFRCYHGSHVEYGPLTQELPWKLFKPSTRRNDWYSYLEFNHIRYIGQSSHKPTRSLWLPDVRRECLRQLGLSHRAMIAESKAVGNDEVAFCNALNQKLLNKALQLDETSSKSLNFLFKFLDERSRRQHYVACIRSNRYLELPISKPKIRPESWFDEKAALLSSWRVPGCDTSPSDRWCSPQRSDHSSNCLPERTVRAAKLFHTARILGTIHLHNSSEPGASSVSAADSLRARGYCLFPEKRRVEDIYPSPTELVDHVYLRHPAAFWESKTWISTSDGYFGLDNKESEERDLWRDLLTASEIRALRTIGGLHEGDIQLWHDIARRGVEAAIEEGVKQALRAQDRPARVQSIMAVLEQRTTLFPPRAMSLPIGWQSEDEKACASFLKIDSDGIDGLPERAESVFEKTSLRSRPVRPYGDHLIVSS